MVNGRYNDLRLGTRNPSRRACAVSPFLALARALPPSPSRSPTVLSASFCPSSRARAPMHSVFVAPGTSGLSQPFPSSRHVSPLPRPPAQQGFDGAVAPEWPAALPCTGSIETCGVWAVFAWSVSLHILPRRYPDLLVPRVLRHDIPRRLDPLSPGMVHTMTA